MRPYCSLYNYNLYNNITNHLKKRRFVMLKHVTFVFVGIVTIVAMIASNLKDE